MKPQEKSKEKEDKHSPLPWKHSRTTPDNWTNIDDANGGRVCMIIKNSHDTDLIVAAVNSHDKLVEALENTTQRLYLLKKHIDILQKSTGSKHGSCHVIEGIEILTKNNEQALAEAKGIG